MAMWKRGPPAYLDKWDEWDLWDEWDGGLRLPCPVCPEIFRDQANERDKSPQKKLRRTPKENAAVWT